MTAAQGFGDGRSVGLQQDGDGATRPCRVRNVMIGNPKTLPAHASVGDARAVLSDDHVHMVLLTEGETLRGTLVRSDLPAAAPWEEPALAWAVLRGRTVHPDTPADRVRERLVHTGMRRLAVIDSGGTLLGLMCIKRSWNGFCSDADVASRASSTPTQDGGTG